jgi:hypothetical protein
MLNLTYEWKVDIAILLALLNLAISAISYIELVASFANGPNLL